MVVSFPAAYNPLDLLPSTFYLLQHLSQLCMSHIEAQRIPVLSNHTEIVREQEWTKFFVNPPIIHQKLHKVNGRTLSADRGGVAPQ